eukprot:6460880-Amphidinium_carterae.1
MEDARLDEMRHVRLIAAAIAKVVQPSAKQDEHAKISNAWDAQQVHGSAILASEPKPGYFVGQVARLRATFLQRMGQEVRFGLRVRVGLRETFVKLPMDEKQFRNWLLEGLCLQSPEKKVCSDDRKLFVKVLGEDGFGMQPFPTRALAKYARRRCSGFEFQWSSMLPLHLQPVLMDPKAQLHAQTTPQVARCVSLTALEECTEAQRLLLSSLCSHGWATVIVPEEDTDRISAAFEAIRSFAVDVEPRLREECFAFFDNSRYVGYIEDAGREWMQLREGFGDRKKFPWPRAAETYRYNFVAAFEAGNRVARKVFAGICEALRDDDDGELSQSLSKAGVLEDAHNAFGASVMRVFMYKDPPHAGADGAASNLHSDMGLLTVSS